MGESQARNKYTYAASVAAKEGYQQIAAIFLDGGLALNRYWRTGGYSLNTENGNLPQRLAALPALWRGSARLTDLIKQALTAREFFLRGKVEALEESLQRWAGSPIRVELRSTTGGNYVDRYRDGTFASPASRERSRARSRKSC